MSDYQISVVIPFFNAYDFFAETLTSVQAQTYPPKEIIVVNDGCGQKAKDFLDQFDGITAIHLEENSGPAKARNTGIQAANGDWIAFLDADDIWNENKLAQQVYFLTEHPEFCACHTGIHTFNQDGIIATFLNKPFDIQISDLLASSHVTPPSLMIKKSALLDVGLFDEHIKCSEDYELSIRLVSRGYKIGFLGEALVKVRRMNHGNISSNAKRILIGRLELLKKHRKTFRKNKGYTAYYLYKTFSIISGKTSGIKSRILHGIALFIKKLFVRSFAPE
ncbi:glycosyltransferase family A protein [Teredinibacter sp. KSP-S5-2]|uniref:glycosyltransferase family 2 protein n=1 Tax=Teredinibacter sp. KSP-S5-2 TaxID=3034506 RepID=UPI00293445C7|nr:glycosyltransferase family A protein [Teredinibacter sp. KSP-S5-2]WNO09044.1 glycosyltransferase family A protein [Teredinibacter sp. KSP-S5-2]